MSPAPPSNDNGGPPGYPESRRPMIVPVVVES
jgi:hypothetical protein